MPESVGSRKHVYRTNKRKNAELEKNENELVLQKEERKKKETVLTELAGTELVLQVRAGQLREFKTQVVQLQQAERRLWETRDKYEKAVVERNEEREVYNQLEQAFLDAQAGLLAKHLKEGEKCLDLGCGNGIIPLLLSGRTKGSSFAGLELQNDIAEMAKRSVAYNEKEDKVHIVQGDIREATSFFEAASFDVVTSNPPYLNQSNGRVSEASHKAIARHELFCTFEDVVKAAAKLLRPGGRFYLVHRPFRLAEIISCMVQYKLEPKRMRLVYPYVDKEPNMVLIEGVRGGNRQLTVEKPLIAYEDTNQYTEEVRRMYYD